MEVRGTLKLINSTKTYGSSDFRKREVVLTTDEQYPQHLLIEFVKDKTDLLDAFEVGQMVQIGINLRGREWTNPEGEVKYFNSIQGWRIDKIEQQDNIPEQSSQTGPQGEDDNDDVPF